MLDVPAFLIPQKPHTRQYDAPVPQSFYRKQPVRKMCRCKRLSQIPFTCRFVGGITLGRTSYRIGNMTLTSAPAAHRFGIATALALALLTMAYVFVLSIGLLTLPSPSHAIQNPWFTLMEVLILAIAPTMVAFTVALHQWVPQERRALSLSAVVFMTMCAVVTCSVHFAILALSRVTTFAEPSIARAVFAFQWPSVAYALDILAWDFFFPISALLAGASLGGDDEAKIRWLFIASALLAFVGLAGVPLADMQLRNIGITGYVLVFPLAAVLMAKRFSRRGDKSAAQPCNQQDAAR